MQNVKIIYTDYRELMYVDLGRSSVSVRIFQHWAPKMGWSPL